MVKRLFSYFLVLFIFFFSFTINIFAFGDEISGSSNGCLKEVTLVGEDNIKVSFPGYILRLSPILNILSQGCFIDLKDNTLDLAFLNVNSKILHFLKECVECLPNASYNKGFVKIGPNDFSEDTIFLNPVLFKDIQNRVENIKNEELGSLYRLAFFLDVRPLYNNIAACISKRLDYTDKRNLKLELEKKGFGNFPDEQLSYIRKHRIINNYNLQEKTVADFLILHKDVKLLEKGRLDLVGRELTSLLGLELIANADAVLSLNLRNNLILGPELDPDFPIDVFKRFPNLKNLCLQGNYLYKIPSKLFSGLRDLQVLDISFNKVININEDAFLDLPKLENLKLCGNVIRELPSKGLFRSLSKLTILELNFNNFRVLKKDVFTGLVNLTNLYIGYGDLEVLEQGSFNDLRALQYLFLNNNKICSLPCNVFKRLLNLKIVNLCYNVVCGSKLDKKYLGLPLDVYLIK